MIKKYLLFSLLLVSTILFSQNRKGQLYFEKENASHQLFVAFEDDVIFTNDNYTIQIKLLSPIIDELIVDYEIAFSKGIEMTDAQFQSLSENAIKVSGSDQSIQNLKNIVRIAMPQETNECLLELAEKLEKLPFIKYCSLHSLEPIQPPFDIAPTTPNWEATQTYIQADPGINMQYAWNLGLIGEGIRIRDVEYGFNKNHEELSEKETYLATGMTISSSASVDYTEHGTAVFGIMYADKGIYGVSGLSHGAAEMILFPEWQQSGYNRANAVTQAIANSTAGDVIIYEMQTGGQGNQFVPAEFNNVIWDLTKAASDAGIVVVAAAGNGNQNLDGAFYTSYMSRGDSGAIIVGAGRANINHNRITNSSWGSTYGSRVDVQAWGENVLSTGVGDAFQVGNDFNQYYTYFSGTSSATPLVAACVVVLQSYYHDLSGSYLTAQQLRTILKETGIPQGPNVSGNIGPIPNMEPAVQRVFEQYLLNNETFDDQSFMVFPNPVQNQVNIVTSSVLSGNAGVEVMTMLGQVVYSSSLTNEKIIDLSFLSSGFYLIKITDNNRTSIKKISKK